MDDGEVTHKELSPYRRSLDVKRATRALEHLVRLHERDGKSPEGSDSTEIQSAREAIASLKATDVATLMLTQDVKGDAAHFLWNRARRALYALSPVIVMRLADKLDDAHAPGSERILSEVARGLGLLVPGAPVEQDGRKAAITETDLADMTDEELSRLLDGERGATEDA